MNLAKLSSSAHPHSRSLLQNSLFTTGQQLKNVKLCLCCINNQTTLEQYQFKTEKQGYLYNVSMVQMIKGYFCDSTYIFST